MDKGTWQAMVHGGVITESDMTSVTKQQQHCRSNPVRDHIFFRENLWSSCFES